MDRVASIPWDALMPVIVVTATGVVAMAIEMIRPRKTNNAIVFVSLVGLSLAAYLIIYNWNLPTRESFGPKFAAASGQLTGGLFLQDRLGQIIQLLLIAIAFLTILFSEGYLREKRIPFGEFYPLVCWSTVGGMVMVTSRDLMIIFLGLETLSISLYVLAGLSQKETRSQESALKYFLLGAFATAFMLYGIALTYGATGTTNAAGLTELFRIGTPDGVAEKVALAGVGMILVGFAFKAAFVPFHLWTPDVYQGAPTVVTGFMATASKVAAFTALLRYLDAAMPMRDVWLPILTVLAVVTMTIGNLVALPQKDAKRILAYSSIAQAGYLLVGVVAWAKSVGTPSAHLGFATVVYYLAAYSLMTLGAFAVLSVSARRGKEGSRLDDLYGMWRKAPFPAAMMILFMASLAGVPPTAGFFGKFLIFKDAVDVGLLWLAIALAVNSVVSVYYYLQIVLAVIRDPELRPTRFAPVNPGLFAACGICAVAVLTIGILISPVMRWFGL